MATVSNGAGNFLTLADAAAALGVSVKTARRWIKAGKLVAELVDGPYGPTYHVPAAAITTARQVLDVVRMERPTDPQTLALAVSRALEEQHAATMRELAAIHQELADLRALVADRIPALDSGEGRPAAASPTAQTAQEGPLTGARDSGVARSDDAAPGGLAGTLRRWWRWLDRGS